MFPIRKMFRFIFYLILKIKQQTKNKKEIQPLNAPRYGGPFISALPATEASRVASERCNKAPLVVFLLPPRTLQPLLSLSFPPPPLIYSGYFSPPSRANLLQIQWESHSGKLFLTSNS